MSDTLSFTELDAQHVELLPARTVLSMMIPSTRGGNNNQGAHNSSHGGNGGTAVAVNSGNINHGSGDQNNVAVASANGGNSNAQQFAWQNYVGGNGNNYQGASNTSHAGNGGLAVAVNAGNINFGSGDQNNVAVASADGGNSSAQQFAYQSFKH